MNDTNEKGSMLQYDEDMRIIEAAESGSPWLTKDLNPGFVFRQHFNPVKVRELVEENQRKDERIAELEEQVQALEAHIERVDSLAIWGWVSAAASDPSVCSEMKEDIEKAFKVVGETHATSLAAVRREAMEEARDQMSNVVENFWNLVDDSGPEE